MCGRYTLTTNDHQALAQRFGAPMPGSGLERYNVAPTEEVLAVVRSEDGAREAKLVRWGLVPSFANDLKGPPLINARSETVTSKPAFKGLVGRADRRCLVIADGFYEWLRPEDPKGRRIPFHFRLESGEPFAMAGLWCWSKPLGDWMASATVLTCSPNTLVARLHDRMPVILPGPEAEEAWLREELATEDVLELCCALPPERMVSAPANPAVNKAGIDEGPELLVAPPEDEAAELSLF